MDPNTAFTLALCALFVSLGSFAVSALTFYRNRTPTPRWEREVKIRTDADGERKVTASVINRGRGVALDVKFVPDGDSLLNPFALRKLDRVEYGEKMDITLIHGPAVEGTGRFVLTWYQEPRVHRKRIKRLKYKLRAIDVPAED